MSNLVNVTLFQANKEGKKVFTASKAVNVKDQNKDLATDLSNYFKAVIELQNKLLKLGLNERAMRKTLPIEITIANEDETFSIHFRNFGKFVEGSTVAKLKKAIELKLDFVQVYGNWTK
jgi:hypothetical protein